MGDGQDQAHDWAVFVFQNGKPTDYRGGEIYDLGGEGSCSDMPNQQKSIAMEDFAPFMAEICTESQDEANGSIPGVLGGGKENV